MRYLLDTHIVLWFLNGEKLSEKIKNLIQDGENYVSVVSLGMTIFDKPARIRLPIQGDGYYPCADGRIAQIALHNVPS